MLEILMSDKAMKNIRNFLLVLTVAFGIASVVLAGMPEEVVLSNGAIGYMPGLKEHICDIAFVVSFSAWLILGRIIKKNSK